MKQWSKHLLDILLIIFGVLIAFWLSNLGDRMKMSRLKSHTLNSIAEELDNNYNLLTKHLNSRDSLLSIIDANLQKAKENRGEINFLINKPIFSKTAYELAKSSGVLHEIDFDLILKIADYYEQMGQIDILENTVITRIFDRGIKSEFNFQLFVSQLRELARNENNLKEIQKELIRIMEEYKQKE